MLLNDRPLQFQASQDSTATSTIPVQAKRPRLSMVWHKEFDGKRERLVAHWVIDTVGKEC